MRVLAIDGSPKGSGRTRIVLERIIKAVGGDADALSIAEGPVEHALELAKSADAFAFGSPVYRASYAAPLKGFLDRLPRGRWGEETAPLRGRAVAIVATGASLHHFLALDDLRNVLAGFFAAHVVPPGLYVPREGFTDDGRLSEPYEQLAETQGRALAELAHALARSTVLKTLEPQA